MWTDLGRAFVTVFVAELPDKTMFATIVLVARFRRPFWVWVGVSGAFAVHVVVAVTAGQVLGLLPEWVVQLVVAALFGTGAVLLFRAGRKAAGAGTDPAVTEPEGSTVGATVAASFGVVVVAEWGDLTQLATAGLAAQGADVVATAAGAFLALVSVAAIAAAFGRGLVARVPIHRVNFVGAAIFAGLAVWTLVELALVG